MFPPYNLPETMLVNGERLKVLKKERVEIPDLEWAEEITLENGEKFLSYQYVYRKSGIIPMKDETAKEKLLRKKKEKINSILEKTKRKWRFR